MYTDLVPRHRVADKVNNTLFLPPCSAQAGCTRLTVPCFVFAGVYSTFCWCEPLLLLVPVSSLQVPCFTFCWCEPLFLLVPISSLLVPCFTFCWCEPLLLLVCVSSFASEQSLHLGNLQARFVFLKFCPVCFLSYADKVVYKVRGAESAFCHHMAVGSER